MRTFVLSLLALLLTATLAVAAELTGTVVKMDQGKSQLVVTTDKGERSLEIGKDTKGLENAKAGAKVKIEYSEKDGKLKAMEITRG